MKNKNKTKAQLIDELSQLQQEISDLKKKGKIPKQTRDLLYDSQERLEGFLNFGREILLQFVII